MDNTAAVLFELNQPLRFVDVTPRALAPGQVLVDIAYTGICHSQLHEIRGRRGPDRFLPHTLGHEGSGTVVDVGKDVAKVKPGDPVVLSWIKGSGQDVPGTVYDSRDGTINSGAISTFLRRTVVSENRVTPISERMPLREAALLGCAIPTGAGIVLNTMQVTPKSSIAIFGVGGIGLSAVLAASMLGAERIIAVDVLDHKLALALRVGATDTVNGASQDPLTAIMEVTKGRGVDYSIEAAGRGRTMEAAFQAVRDNGGLCVLAGNLEQGQRISIDPFLLIRGKKISGTWGGETQTDRDIPQYVEAFLKGQMKLSDLITHEYPIENINQAFEDLEDGRVGRALVRMSRVERKKGKN